ncbi:MAG: glycerol acyltransferase [Bacteroidetes bacterium]|nr:MAG: glycerol acyltransferase [Bacteroidota bacterium]
MYAHSPHVIPTNLLKFLKIKGHWGKNQIQKHNKAPQKFDLEKIIGTKNPQLLKLLPGPLLRYIKQVVHQEEFNDFLHQTENNYDHDFVRAAIKNFQVEVTSKGLENIPKGGGCIIACNHPLGGLDGIAVMNEVSKIRTDIKAMVNDILMNIKNLNGLFIPVNKHGKNAIEGVKLIDQTFASGECIIVFPAGFVSRKQCGKIKDLEWKKSFITKAIKYKRDIVPAYIDAKNSNFFYNLASFRKKIGIKANIEMFYLLDEAYKQKGKCIKITVGNPIPYSTFTKNHSNMVWAEKVKEHVYGLKDGRKIL